VLRDFEKGRVLKPYYRSLDELVEARNYAAERALLELLKTGRSALPAPPQRARRPETKLSRRMRRSSRARRLARRSRCTEVFLAPAALWPTQGRIHGSHASPDARACSTPSAGFVQLLRQSAREGGEAHRAVCAQLFVLQQLRAPAAR